MNDHGSKPPLNRSHLEALLRSAPGKEVVDFLARCHPEAGTITGWCAEHQVLHVRCKQCERLIVNVQVADPPEARPPMTASEHNAFPRGRW